MSQNRWPPFPFFWHRTMADVLKDEASDALRHRKQADQIVDWSGNVRPTDPSNDPFAQ